MNPQEILFRAAEDIEKYGHNKETFFGPLGPSGSSAELPACAMGAISRYLPEGIRGVGDDATSTLLAEHLLETGQTPTDAFGEPFDTPEPYDVISLWNDAQERTAEQVAAEMRKAAGMADIGEDGAKIIEFEPVPEAAPVPTPTPAPAEPVPA